MTMDSRTLQSLLILLVGLMPAVCLGSAASVLAADASETTGQSQPGEKGKSDEQADKKDEEEPGELFPGVKGISGKELARRIAEIERKKAQRQKQRPTAAADATSRPPEGDAGGRPAQPVVEKPPAKDRALAEESLASLNDEAKRFLKERQKRTSRIERILPKAAEIRRDANAEAKRLGNEARIQYYLRYKEGYIRETRAYHETMLFPVLVYRYIYEQATSALVFDRDNRPADLPKEALATVEREVAQLHDARRVCLIAAGELYTQVRRMDAAETIYRVLLKRHPSDKDVRKSYAAFVEVRDTPKPAGPPGIQRNTRYEVDPREESTGTDEGGGEGETTPQIPSWNR